MISVRMAKFLRSYWPVILALCFFAYNSIELNFVQDDAYISYRYVANYLNGNGLVYNIGERVEGITNTGWVVLMILWGRLGLDFIFWSQVFGFICGIGVILISFLIGRRLFGKSQWLTVATVLLVGINLSLAYWSSAGLETAPFAFLVMLSIYLYITRNWLLISSLALAVWIRPEGAMLAGLFIVIEIVLHKRWPSFSVTSVAIAFVISLPFVIFKIAYYGSILPNPFYAKTGLGWLQISNGLEYTGRFMKHYGFFGFGYIIPLLFWRKLSIEFKAVSLFMIGYTAYIVLIGGDVLKVHRFFLPLFGPAAISVMLSIFLITKGLRPGIRNSIYVTAIIPLLALTYLLPRNFIKVYNRNEKDFTRRMAFQAKEMKKWDKSDFSVALPTIGIFGYELLGHNIIDMLGLTDSTIARHSEEPIPGMQTTWKEQKHNSKYILESAPDYIIFSTGIKPSAPAEKALLLFTQFLRSYRSVGWFYEMGEKPGRGSMLDVFKKVRPLEGEIKATHPPEYVAYYKDGLDALFLGDPKKALQNFNKALKVSPEPYNLDLLYQKASIHIDLGDEEIVNTLLNYILQSDSMVYLAHKDFYSLAFLTGDAERAELHKRWLLELVPWYVPRIDSLLSKRMESLQSSGAGHR